MSKHVPSTYTRALPMLREDAGGCWGRGGETGKLQDLPDGHVSLSRTTGPKVLKQFQKTIGVMAEN